MHGALRKVDGVDEGLLLALVEDVLNVFRELFGEGAIAFEDLAKAGRNIAQKVDPLDVILRILNRAILMAFLELSRTYNLR